MKKFLFLLAILISPFAFSAQLEISNSKVRANIPGSDNTAGYMVAANFTKDDISIIGVESDIAEFTELHSHTMKGDRMIMRHVKKVDIDAGETAYFAPNKYHIMFINLKSRAKHGESAKVTFHYNDGTSQTVAFDIIDPKEISG
ncbi:copper chaperone PCu(A)C [Alteromonas sp. 5E99-2]|uniref:copper chaperone PCu(A)C n=1 Tax=Alteromonas sp. 5E99-2 TaxID=2817683 RepID=UPI001A9A1B1E|nr:copper chaperone PCu(A)C [Alteromonas sp. 5E99-2]MBO1254199.1 copper chaperone PCu(A)C [Alteromonas sp. 5E99-2]